MKDVEEYYNNILKNDYTFGVGLAPVINEEISMELNEYGEYKPNLDCVLKKKETKEQEFEISILDIAPNSDKSLNEDIISENLYKKIPGINYEENIGYFKDLYAGYVIEGDYRENASSGGFGTWIFKELFERNLIDGVIHVKANMNENDPVLFQYDISRSIDEIKQGAKTKYYPVELSRVIKIVKETPGRYAIIGIPSFIMAIRLLAEKDSVIKDRIKFTIGLICGHQKSSKFADSLAWQVGIEPGNLKAIDFRKKLPDAPSNQYGVEMVGIKDGELVTITKSMKELVGNGWGHGFFKSNASDFTDDVMNETADIVLGDAWLPQYSTDSNGNNVILIRNEKIAEIINTAIENKKIKVDEISVETFIKSQASHFQHTKQELSYRLYKKDKIGQWRPSKRVEASNSLPIIRKKIQDLRMEIAKESHLSFEKAVELNDLTHFIKHMEKYTLRYERIYLIKSFIEMGPKKIISKVLSKLTFK